MLQSGLEDPSIRENILLPGETTAAICLFFHHPCNRFSLQCLSRNCFSPFAKTTDRIARREQLNHPLRNNYGHRFL
jgi:hypothetical protein